MIKTISLENKAFILKGQKIVAALFLVTGHLSETDPLRLKVRSYAVDIIDADPKEREFLAATITSLLEAAVLAGIVSEGNARIIEAELKYFADPLYHADNALSTIFPSLPSDKGHFIDKRTEDKTMSFIPKTAVESVSEKKQLPALNKNNRQEKILSYINDRKSANIKDISSLFPDVSEKTIQRELGTLVVSGKINKRGNKRWSIYLAV